jgi:hypothetical protein
MACKDFLEKSKVMVPEYVGKSDDMADDGFNSVVVSSTAHICTRGLGLDVDNWFRTCTKMIKMGV